MCAQITLWLGWDAQASLHISRGRGNNRLLLAQSRLSEEPGGWITRQLPLPRFLSLALTPASCHIRFPTSCKRIREKVTKNLGGEWEERGTYSFKTNKLEVSIKKQKKVQSCVSFDSLCRHQPCLASACVIMVSDVVNNSWGNLKGTRVILEFKSSTQGCLWMLQCNC